MPLSGVNFPSIQPLAEFCFQWDDIGFAWLVCHVTQGGLNVAMNDGFGVRDIQSVRNLDSQFQDIFHC